MSSLRLVPRNTVILSCEVSAVAHPVPYRRDPSPRAALRPRPREDDDMMLKCDCVYACEDRIGEIERCNRVLRMLGLRKEVDNASMRWKLARKGKS